MKPISKPTIMVVAAVFLTIQTAVFMFINILIDVGHPTLRDSALPTQEHWGLLHSIGWNINLQLIFGKS